MNLTDPSNLIFLLGRNSSGKSSFLRALFGFNFDKNLEELDGYRNFDPSEVDPQIHPKFAMEAGVLSVKAALSHAEAVFLNAGLNPHLRTTVPGAKQVEEHLNALFQAIVDSAELASTLTVVKFGTGGYRFQHTDETVKERRKALQTALSNLFPGTQPAQLSGTTVKPILAGTLENSLAAQLPRISYFGESHHLNDNIPSRFTNDRVRQLSGLPLIFANYLGSARLDRFLNTNKPKEQKGLLKEMQERADALAGEINRHAEVTGRNRDLIEIELSSHDGLQVTVITDGKESFYSHMSENTKLLFAYYLYLKAQAVNSDVLLFDEPSNGYHPSAQEFLLNFLKDLGAVGKQVILSTHSEYMIDLDHLSSVRTMAVDDHGSVTVRNHCFTQPQESGDYLALQPILNAIGLRYGSQLHIAGKAIVTEGITDLMYLRAFNSLLGLRVELPIAPTRGDAQIPHLVSFLVSQGISLKIVLDCGEIKRQLTSDFAISEEFIYEIPIPAEFVGRAQGSGIEDLFTKADFRMLLGRKVNHTPDPEFDYITNSAYAKKHIYRQKRLIAHGLLAHIGEYQPEDFSEETRAQFTSVLEFCGNGEWFVL